MPNYFCYTPNFDTCYSINSDSSNIKNKNILTLHDFECFILENNKIKDQILNDSTIKLTIKNKKSGELISEKNYLKEQGEISYFLNNYNSFPCFKKYLEIKEEYYSALEKMKKIKWCFIDHLHTDNYCFLFGDSIKNYFNYKIIIPENIYHIIKNLDNNIFIEEIIIEDIKNIHDIILNNVNIEDIDNHISKLFIEEIRSDEELITDYKNKSLNKKFNCILFVNLLLFLFHKEEILTLSIKQYAYLLQHLLILDIKMKDIDNDFVFSLKYQINYFRKKEEKNNNELYFYLKFLKKK